MFFCDYMKKSIAELLVFSMIRGLRRLWICLRNGRRVPCKGGRDLLVLRRRSLS